MIGRLSGNFNKGKEYRFYEGYGGDTAIEDFNLIDLEGDNEIKATNEVSDNEYYYSFAVSNSTLTTGDGDDSYEIKTSKGKYNAGLHESSIYSNEGNDSISIDLNEVLFRTNSNGIAKSLINTGAGNDKISIKINKSLISDNFSSRNK